MNKKITPCVENLMKALRATATAHNAEFEDWTDEGQVGIATGSVPVFADVSAILASFYRPEFAQPDFGWGYVTAYIYDDEFYEEDGSITNPFLPEVDEARLLMALPYGLQVDWEKS